MHQGLTKGGVKWYVAFCTFCFLKNEQIWTEDEKVEREKIRDFWISLRDDERRALVKLEKEAVLKKMKEQQKHVSLAWSSFYFSSTR
jgi:hypothetical protein